MECSVAFCKHWLNWLIALFRSSVSLLIFLFTCSFWCFFFGYWERHAEVFYNCRLSVCPFLINHFSLPCTLKLLSGMKTWKLKELDGFSAFVLFFSWLDPVVFSSLKHLMYLLIWLDSLLILSIPFNFCSFVPSFPSLDYLDILFLHA